MRNNKDYSKLDEVKSGINSFYHITNFIDKYMLPLSCSYVALCPESVTIPYYISKIFHAQKFF